MQNEKEIFNLIKETYPQSPNRDFIVSTENKLRQKARIMNRNWKIKRLSVVSSGIFLFILAFSWLFIFTDKDVITSEFSEQEVITNDLNTHGGEILSSPIDEKSPLVFIYHSHNQESYNELYSETNNVTLVGKELSKALNDYNINTIHDDTDIFGILKERNLSFSNAYTVSREKLQEMLNKHKSIKMVFDIHRDVQQRSATTINIDGEDYARIALIVSKTSDNYEENRDFAIRLHEKLEELYPGLSRGVIEKGENPVNTYNQDLRNNTLLLDIGGIENTFEESFRTTNVFAEVITSVIK